MNEMKGVGGDNSSIQSASVTAANRDSRSTTARQLVESRPKELGFLSSSTHLNEIKVLDI